MPQGSKSGSLLADRRAAWQEAFRGLFYALRNYLCDAFYLETPPVSSHCSGMACTAQIPRLLADYKVEFQR